MGKFKKTGTFKSTKSALRKCPAKPPVLYSPLDTKAWISPQEKRKTEHGYKFESCFLPLNDELLKQAGVEVCALTDVLLSKHEKSLKKVFNKIVFENAKTGKRASVDCIHTVVGELSEEGFTETSIERREDLQEILSPEDQYFALKSFTEALALQGIQGSLIESFKREITTGIEPFDFNQLMRQQITKALVEVAPEETKQLALFLLEYLVMGVDDPQRMEYLMDAYAEDIIGGVVNIFTLEELDKLDTIDGGIISLDYKILKTVARNPNLSEELQEKLASNINTEIRNAITWNPNLSSDVFIKLADDKSTSVKESVAKMLDTNRNVSVKQINDLVKKLGTDKDVTVRNAIIERAWSREKKGEVNLPVEVLRVMSISGESRGHRDMVARQPDLPVDIIRNLMKISDPFIRMDLAPQKNLPEDVMRKLVKITPPEEASGESGMMYEYLSRRTDLPRDVELQVKFYDDLQKRRLEIANLIQSGEITQAEGKQLIKEFEEKYKNG